MVIAVQVKQLIHGYAWAAAETMRGMTDTVCAQALLSHFVLISTACC